MQDTSVTHEILRAGQVAMLDRLDNHERRFQEISRELFAKMDKLIDSSHNNAMHVTRVDATLAKILEDRPGYLQEMRDMRSDIDSLQATRDLQSGERGVLAAMAKSPFFVGLAAAAATAWAFIHGTGKP